MRRFASIALVSLSAACGADVTVDAAGTGASPSASSPAPSTARVVAHDAALGYCGTFYSYCPMFVLGERVFFRAMTAPGAAGPFAASIRSARTSDADGSTTPVATASDASNLFGPFPGGDGVEWLVQSGVPATLTLFTSTGTDVAPRTIASFQGTSIVAGDDPVAIYLFMGDSTLVRVAKSDGAARAVGALDGFVPIAAVADDQPDGFLYATGLDGIARVSKASALLATLSTNQAGTPFGDRLAVGAGQLFAVEEGSSSSTILARALSGGALRAVARSAGGSSSIVVDGTSVYWIALAASDGAQVASGLWRAPLAGGTPKELYAESGASRWLTGVAFDGASIYVTTSDGRLLALAK